MNEKIIIKRPEAEKEEPEQIVLIQPKTRPIPPQPRITGTTAWHFVPDENKEEKNDE